MTEQNLDAASQRAERLRQRKEQRQQMKAACNASANAFQQQQQQQQASPMMGLQLQRPTPIRPTPIRLRPQAHSYARPAPLHRPKPIRNNSCSSSWHPGAANVSNNRTAGGRRMQTAERLHKKYKKKKKKPSSSWYHSVAEKNKLGAIHEDAFLSSTSTGASASQEEVTPSTSTNLQQQGQHQSQNQTIREAKKELLQELNRTGGESNTPAFQAALQKLVQQYDSSNFDPRKPVPRYYNDNNNDSDNDNQLEGVGIAAGKPTFPGCIGRNDQGDPMYKLGTMSFGMFGPTQLVVSVQGTFVLIDTVDGRNMSGGVQNVPQNLVADVRFGRSPVRTYNIVTPCTIEPWKPEFGDDSPNKGIDQPIRGVLTSNGFIHPYPTQNRFSVWFTGGSLEIVDQINNSVNDANNTTRNKKNEKWFQIFDKDTAPKRTKAEAGQLETAMALLGASNNNNELDQDGKLTYSLTKPQASHIDLIYLDKSLQVLRGSSGTVYVHVRLPGSKAVHDSVRSDELLPAPVDPCWSEQLEDDQATTTNDDDDHHGINNNNHELLLRGGLQGRARRRGSTGMFSSARKAHSNYDLDDSQSSQQQQQQYTSSAISGADARLQELQSFVVSSTCNERKSKSGGLRKTTTSLQLELTPNTTQDDDRAPSSPQQQEQKTHPKSTLLGKAREYATRGFRKAKPKNGVAGVA